MAHEVETMAYFGALPWHRLGTALEEGDLYDWPAASRKAGVQAIQPRDKASSSQTPAAAALARKRVRFPIGSG